MNIVQCMFFFQSKRKKSISASVGNMLRFSSFEQHFSFSNSDEVEGEAEIYSDLIDFLAASNSSSIHTIALRYDDLCA